MLTTPGKGGLMTVIASTDRPKSVRNTHVIQKIILFGVFSVNTVTYSKIPTLARELAFLVMWLTCRLRSESKQRRARSAL